MAVPTPSTEEHAVVPGRSVPEGARHNGPGPDDEFLVALAKHGRTDAYDQLVRRYRRFVRVKSSSYFLLGGDADDLIQKACWVCSRPSVTTRPSARQASAA